MLVLTAGGKRERDALLRHKTVSSRSRGPFTSSTDIVFPIPSSPITRLKYTYCAFSKLWAGLAQTV